MSRACSHCDGADDGPDGFLHRPGCPGKSRWNPGWEEFGAWVDSIDMTGPTPGLINLSQIERGFVERDRDRLIDEARD